MKIAINYSHRGKNPKGTPDEARAFFRQFNGQFQNVEVEPEEWMAAVYQGFAFTTQHARYRDQDNFSAGQHLAIDYDTGDYRSSFDALLRDPFIFCFASFLYATASSRPDAPKTRVCFALDRPMHSREKFALLAQSLLHRYGRPRKPRKGDAAGWARYEEEVKKYRVADRSCKDVARLFFGSQGCEMKYLGNTLSLDVAATELVMPFLEWQYREEEAARERARGAVVLGPADVSRETLERHLDRLLAHVRNAPDGEQHDTIRDIGRTLGGYCQSGYFGESEVIAALQVAIRSNAAHKDLFIADETIVEAVRYGRLSPLSFERIQ